MNLLARYLCIGVLGAALAPTFAAGPSHAQAATQAEPSTTLAHPPGRPDTTRQAQEAVRPHAYPTPERTAPARTLGAGEAALGAREPESGAEARDSFNCPVPPGC